MEVSGAWSRGLLIAEAVRAGLANPELKIQNNRRLRRIDALVPRKLALRLKEAADGQQRNPTTPPQNIPIPIPNRRPVGTG